MLQQRTGPGCSGARGRGQKQPEPAGDPQWRTLRSREANSMSGAGVALGPGNLKMSPSADLVKATNSPPESEQRRQTLHLTLGATGPGSGSAASAQGPLRAPSPGSCPISASSPSQGPEGPHLCVGPAQPWVSPLQTSLWKCPRGGSGFEPRPYLHFTEEAGAAPGAAAGRGCGAVAQRAPGGPSLLLRTTSPLACPGAEIQPLSPESLHGHCWGSAVALLPGPQPSLGGDGDQGPAHGAQTGTKDPVPGEPPLHTPGPGGLRGLGSRARSPSLPSAS